MIDGLLSLLEYAIYGVLAGFVVGVVQYIILPQTSTVRGAVPLVTLFGYVPVGVIVAVIMFILGF